MPQRLLALGQLRNLPSLYGTSSPHGDAVLEHPPPHGKHRAKLLFTEHLRLQSTQRHTFFDERKGILAYLARVYYQ
jgi:hypothetical protein